VAEYNRGMSLPLNVISINLSPNQGGAEVYADFFAKACVENGWQCQRWIAPDTSFWHADDSAFGQRVVIYEAAQLAALLRRVEGPKLLINHTSLPSAHLAALAAIGPWYSFAHHVITERNKYAYYAASHQLLAVSQHVIDTCRAAGITHCWPEPLYGVAHIDRGANGMADIVRRSPYEWDPRKPRDQLLRRLHPLRDRWLKSPPWVRRQGALTLGIVSRLADLKQFPTFFAHVVPALLDAGPNLYVEVFGSGLYREVKRIEAALSPLRDRVRFWGWQPKPRAAYQYFDYLLTGLPEREALGLNLIEAQRLGTPVLAINAPPFSEIVSDGVTGYLYADPRADCGRSLANLVARLAAGERLNLASAEAARFLRRFDAEVYRERLSRILQQLKLSD
jgi:glycosyltransferase involved in cell wall biosynthesis